MAVLMVVRRGEDDRFRFLQEAFAHEPVTIMWDRRVADAQEVCPIRHEPAGAQDELLLVKRSVCAMKFSRTASAATFASSRK